MAIAHQDPRISVRRRFDEKLYSWIIIIHSYLQLWCQESLSSQRVTAFRSINLTNFAAIPLNFFLSFRISRAKLREIVIYLGELDTQNSGLIFEPLPAEKHSVVQKFVHPRFRFRLTQPDRFDIAALKLRRPAGYKSVILKNQATENVD